MSHVPQLSLLLNTFFNSWPLELIGPPWWIEGLLVLNAKARGLERALLQESIARSRTYTNWVILWVLGSRTTLQENRGIERGHGPVGLGNLILLHPKNCPDLDVGKRAEKLGWLGRYKLFSAGHCTVGRIVAKFLSRKEIMTSFSRFERFGLAKRLLVHRSECILSPYSRTVTTANPNFDISNPCIRIL